MKSDEIDTSVGARLHQFWLREGAAVLLPPAAEQEIISFEKNNKINIPLDFRSYLRCVNGFDQYCGHQDARGFNFWPLQDIASLAGYDGGRYKFPGSSSKYFLFCDHLDFSWGYALSIDGSDHQVILVGTRDGRPKVVANSFTTFVDAYLNDAPVIYL